jgi:hypothetical protein
MPNKSDKTPKQMAVAVARDVLKQLAAKKIKATNGILLSATLKKVASIDGEECDLQEAIKAGALKKCEVCARGSLIMGYANLYDNINAYKELSALIVPSEDEQVVAAFPHLDTEALEDAFEAASMTWFPNDDSSGATQYGRSIKGTPGQRLAVLMRNIIRNKGEFIVPEKFRKQAEEEAQF